ncbi:hypothetical protein HZA33_02255 [Candidatus Pacearchaeota archaeon]|nr:hypothetical protein [Candidatus Pacearchaeota archaeon]
MTRELYGGLRKILERSEGYILQRYVAAVRKILEKEGYKVRGPESHIGGEYGPSQRHICVSGRGKLVRNSRGFPKKVRAHIFITLDPRDPRLYK